ncbi:PIN domain-containing protein [Antribacter sp. KLBMP9083]|uniref:Ribonuclease VapC n=1 Tax=Antribacter soli TaxID=2910976 RepID=A0AA41U846_9MICO|nr:PIN domain-containing protein [Antribacter soli]MCF4122055.1 PIN domain-containing protein [Antribacter soli]
MRAAVFDTGPIVGALDASDNRHAECAAFLTSFTGTRYLPTTVLTEVCWMLEDWPDVEADFLDSVARGTFTLVPLEKTDLERMSQLVRRYGDFPLGTTDASVVAIAERLGVSDVATIDHRHFHAVRPRHIEAFTLLL